jgi:hypothetical protein
MRGGRRNPKPEIRKIEARDPSSKDRFCFGLRPSVSLGSDFGLRISHRHARRVETKGTPTRVQLKSGSYFAGWRLWPLRPGTSTRCRNRICTPVAGYGRFGRRGFQFQLAQARQCERILRVLVPTARLVQVLNGLLNCYQPSRSGSHLCLERISHSFVLCCFWLFLCCQQGRSTRLVLKPFTQVVQVEN